MTLSYRTVRNMCLFGLLFIIIGISLFSFYTMHTTEEQIATFMTVEQAKLVEWFAFLDVITDSKDYLYDYQLGKKTVASPALLLINLGIEIVEKIKDETTNEVELVQIEKLTKELRRYRQAVFVYTEEVSGGHRAGATAREMEEVSSKAGEDIVQMSLNVTELIGHAVKDRSMEIIAMTRASQRILYVALVGSVLCTFVISIVMGKALARPIRKLAMGAKNISEGDLASRVQIDSDDEIGLLAAAFNDMAEKIYERSNELASSNELLHQEVAVRMQTEKILLTARKEAELANEAKSQFLANMSHEIRTPMNGIIGFSDLLADEPLTDAQKVYVDTIRQSGNNLLGIINDILDFSKIEAGQLNVELIECSLSSLLNSVGALMRPRAIEKGLKFEIIESIGVPGKIISDPTRLQQCLINLIGNAVKFTNEGHVYISVSLEDIDSKPFVCFAVEDTGIGIAGDKHDVVFDSFSQADDSHTRKYGGTGLGLSITRQLAMLLGGDLSVASEEGQGTTFTLRIPIGADVAEPGLLNGDNSFNDTETETVEMKQVEFAGNVLVAEDDSTNQMLIKLLLGKLGLQVTIVEDGMEAMEEVLKGGFDLVFMDMQMPKMNGYEASRGLRQEGVETPIIALTANAFKGDEAKCIEAGCDEYLSKPIEFEKLEKVIAKYLPMREFALTNNPESGKS